MKIILFIDYLCSGGAQSQLVELAKLFKKLVSVDVTVAVYHNDNILKPVLDEQQIKFQVIHGAQNKYARIYRIYRYFAKERPDVVISYLTSPNIIACICHFFYPKFRLIVSERSTSHFFLISDRIRFLLYCQAKYVVPNSFSQFDFIQRNSPRLKKKLKVITNCVDTEKYALRPISIISNPVRILTVARITSAKNIPNYLLALKKLKQQGIKFKAKWYGRYDDETLFRHCMDLIQEYQIEDVFQFCGESMCLVPIYHDADVFCLPSLYEGFPNVVCEAMSTGLPVACSNVCDNAIIVEDGVNGILFNPLDPCSINKGLRDCIMLAENKLNKIATLNREKMLKLCSKEQFIDNYYKLLL